MKLTTTIIAFTISLSSVVAQLVSDATNEIYFKFDSTAETSGATVSLPSISWEFPTSQYTNSEENQVTFKSLIESRSPLQEILISVSKGSDGSSIFPPTALKIPDNSLKYVFEKQLYLIDGENVVTLEVINMDGGRVADSRNILIGFDAISKAVDINRKDYGLFIATDKYDHWPDLVNPVFDSEIIAKELEDNYNFDTELLLDPEQEDILIKIKEYATKKYRPQDQLLIFIAGHGQFDDGFGEGYLVTKNSLLSDPARTTYIPHSVLRNAINNIPCDHILLVMDVCFSGTFDPVIAASRGDVYDEIDDTELLVRKLSKKTRRYLTAGGKEYVSDGIPGKHSPFAQRFIEVLRTRGGDDRIITLTEMYPTMQRLQTLPRTGEFGSNEKDSDFVFVVQSN
jgi:hypothetical protein